MGKNKMTFFEKNNELVIPDASPLIYLAKMNLLDLLPAMYENIVVTDVVWIESTRYASEFEDAARILKWGEKLQEMMPHRFIIAETLLGQAFEMAIQKNAEYRGRNAGELSIAEWASNAADDFILKEIHPDILYENGKVLKLVASFKIPVTTLNTSAFLKRAIKAGHALSLEKILNETARMQIYFNQASTFQHNDAALKELSHNSDKKEQSQAERPEIGFKEDRILGK